MVANTKRVNPHAAEINRHTPATRNSGLRRVRLVNRWLVATAVTLTLAVSAVVAQASGGRTISRGSGAAAAASKASSTASTSSTTVGSAQSAVQSQPAVSPSAVVTASS